MKIAPGGIEQLNDNSYNTLVIKQEIIEKLLIIVRILLLLYRLLPRFKWSLTMYDITLTGKEKTEKTISFYTRKWLGVPWYLSEPAWLWLKRALRFKSHAGRVVRQKSVCVTWSHGLVTSVKAAWLEYREAGNHVTRAESGIPRASGRHPPGSYPLWRG